MNILQEAFDQELKDIFKPSRLGTELVRKKLLKLGIEVTETQLDDIKSQFELTGNDTFHLEIEDHQIIEAGFESEEQFQQTLSNFFEELALDIETYANKFDKELPAVIMKSTDQLSHDILKDLKISSKEMLKDRASDIHSFESNLVNVYRNGFELLEMLIVTSLGAGDSFNNSLRAEASLANDYVFEVLTRLHARACQIAYEILVLLKSGLADGAHARWRSLHEISVTAFLIGANDNTLAERYLLHDEVESYKAAQIYQEHYASLGYEPLSVEEIADLKKIHDSLVDRFGKNYRSDYGWASVVTKNERPTFRDIERCAGLEHLRPYYKMACHNVHANPKGIFFKLGLYPESGDILLAGPSNVGLTDPGQLTALSLSQISTTLLTQEPNIDRIVVCKILLELEREIAQAFSDAENSIKEKLAYNKANSADAKKPRG
jgi:hypothetical protein